MLAHWLDDIEAFEAISQDAETRRIFLRMSALSKSGGLPGFLEQIAHERRTGGSSSPSRSTSTAPDASTDERYTVARSRAISSVG